MLSFDGYNIIIFVLHRRVIMNDCLAAGTQIPWIQQAVKEGYAVIVLNPNLNKHQLTGKPIRVRLSNADDEYSLAGWR